MDTLAGAASNVRPEKRNMSLPIDQQQYKASLKKDKLQTLMLDVHDSMVKLAMINMRHQLDFQNKEYCQTFQTWIMTLNVV